MNHLTETKSNYIQNQNQIQKATAKRSAEAFSILPFFFQAIRLKTKLQNSTQINPILIKSIQHRFP